MEEKFINAMNKKIYILLVYVSMAIFTQGQSLCDPIGIHTSPIAPDVPLNSAYTIPLPQFENSFNWYEHSNGQFLPWPLVEMTQYPNNVNFMSHPLSVVNSSSDHSFLINSIPLEDRDIYPKDGWELIGINLGFYPDGTPLTEIYPFVPSYHSSMPYIILYNKRRASLRIFFNHGTQAFSNFTKAILTISHEIPNDQTNVSGLLRLSGGNDIALDKPTITKKTSVVVNFPNNPTKWMYAEFPMAFDPCICSYPSSLQIRLHLVNSLNLQLSSLSLTANLNLTDSNGNLAVQPDFFANLSNADINPGITNLYNQGSTIFKEINNLIENYRLKLRETQLLNNQISQNNVEIKKKISVLNAAKLIVQAGIFIITPAIAAGAAQQTATQELFHFATLSNSVLNGMNQSQQISYLQNSYMDGFNNLHIYEASVVKQVMPDGSKELDVEKLLKKASEYTGKGFDFLSNHLKKKLQQEVPKPQVPTGSMTESVYSGTIASTQDMGGPSFWTPGTYPNIGGNNELAPFVYPIYNEALGLFALLETPKFEIEQPNSSVEVANLSSTQSYASAEVSRNQFGKFKLKDPLKYALNPASGMLVPNVTIKAAITIDQSFNESFPNLVRNDLNNYWTNSSWDAIYFDNFTTNIDNLREISLSRESGKLVLESDFVPIELFNDLVMSYEMIWKQDWNISLADPDDAYPVGTPNAELLAYANQNLTENLTISFPKITLKLLVTMPFPDGPDGSTYVTEQLFTYRITEDELIPVGVGETLTPTWSYTQNPNGNGSLSLQEALGFTEKIWTEADYDLYGGYLNSSGQKVVRPTAWKQINIYGDQMVGSGIAAVDFVAGEAINVTGNAQIDPEMNLLLQDPVQATSTPNPPVTQAYLTSYCQGQGPNTYQANQARYTPKPIQKPDTKERPEPNLEIALFPNPAGEYFTISTATADLVSAVEVYTPDGRLVSSYAMPYRSAGAFVDYSTAELINGYYYVRVLFDNRESVVKPLVVMRP